MANTLSLSFNAAVTLGSLSDPITLPNLSISMSAQGAAEGIQVIGTSSEDVAMGDVATSAQGWCILYNLDATNYIEWGYDDTGTIKIIGKLLAGEWAVFRLAVSQQLMARANTASCNLWYRIYKA